MSTASTNQSMSTNGSGWASFAGYIMVVAGIFQMIVGFAALFKSDVYISTENTLLLFDYSQWGWIHILIGFVLTLSAISLFAGQLWGRTVAIVLATLSAIANFGFIQAYPIWSILIIIMDVLIIYGVAMHGGRDEI